MKRRLSSCLVTLGSLAMLCASALGAPATQAHARLQSTAASHMAIAASMAQTGTPNASMSNCPVSLSWELTHQISCNWSGYIAYNDTFTYVAGDWNTQCGPDQSGASVSTWVGIGGVYGNMLQAGTWWVADQSGHYGYRVFIEFVGYTSGSGVDWNVAPLPCGTGVEADVWYNGPQWCAQILYSNKTLIYKQCFTSSWTPNESTAEWIDERPLCHGVQPALARFNWTAFSNGWAYSPVHGWNPIGGYARYQMEMRDLQSNLRLAAAEPLSSSSTFRDDFLNSDSGPACGYPGS